MTPTVRSSNTLPTQSVCSPRFALGKVLSVFWHIDRGTHSKEVPPSWHFSERRCSAAWHGLCCVACARSACGTLWRRIDWGDEMYIEFGAGGRILAAYLDQQYPGQRWLPIDSRTLQAYLAAMPTVARDAMDQRGRRWLWR